MLLLLPPFVVVVVVIQHLLLLLIFFSASWPNLHAYTHAMAIEKKTAKKGEEADEEKKS